MLLMRRYLQRYARGAFPGGDVEDPGEMFDLPSWLKAVYFLDDQVVDIAQMWGRGGVMKKIK